jgi:hypothetical protein
MWKVIMVDRVVVKKSINWKKWGAEEEESHKGLLSPPPKKMIRIK